MSRTRPYPLTRARIESAIRVLREYRELNTDLDPRDLAGLRQAELILEADLPVENQ